jgi:gentisate 1,2-dioxygenase
MVPGREPAGPSNRVEVGGGSVVPKSGTSVEDTKPTLGAGMHSHEIGMVFDLAKGAADIVITDVNFLGGIGDAQVVQPNHEFQLSTGKGERWFSTFGSPVVDGKTPGLGTEGAVKNGPRVFVEGI